MKIHGDISSNFSLLKEEIGFKLERKTKVEEKKKKEAVYMIRNLH